MLDAIDHVGIAVEDIDAALSLYGEALGMALVHRETVESQGVDAALLDVGDAHIELLSPLGPETPVGKFLARRGSGLHHVAYRVSDVSETLRKLSDAGLRLIDEEPRTGDPRIPRSLPTSRLHGRRSHRDRPTGGEPLTWPTRDRRRSTSDSPADRC